MRSRILFGMLTFATTALMGCADIATKPDASSPKEHVDLAYTQFILKKDVSPPIDVSLLGQVSEQCQGPPTERTAGGTDIFSSVIGSVISYIAKAVVTELQNLVNAEIAKYSSEVVGKPSRNGFYAAQNWFVKSVPDAGTSASDVYSCFAVVINKCPAASVDKGTGLCPSTVDNAHVILVGQYRLTKESLQVRPLFGQVKGFEPKRNASAKASIAATLKFESVWWDGHEGHNEAPMTSEFLSMNFNPTDGGPGDPGIDLAIKHKDAHNQYVFDDWSARPLLVRPPQSPGSDGTVSVTTTVAEANAPPELLTLIKKELGDNSSKLSSALQSALTKVVE
jgi:hypothetical protein